MGKKFTKDDFRSMAPKYKFVPHLDRALASFDEEWSFKYEVKTPDLAWHPSSHALAKATDLYDHARDYIDAVALVPRDISLTFRKSGYVGHFWHQLLQYITVEKLGFASWDEVECVETKAWASELVEDDPIIPLSRPKPFHYVTGAADLAPVHLPVYGDYLVDFKTMTAAHYRLNTLPAGFGPKYEAQINIYMDLFDVEKGLIVCVQKDTPHDFKEFEYRRNDELVAAIYDKWKFVSECLDAGERPTGLDDTHFIHVEDGEIKWA